MKRNKSVFAVLAVALFFALVFTGCEEPEETYTVWTGTMTYSAFQAEFGGEITNNYIASQPLTFAKRDSGVLALNGQEFEWTEEEIKNYFISWDIPDEQVSTMTSKLINFEYGFIALREGNNVHVIIK